MVVVVAETYLFFDAEGWREERSVKMVFQRFKAADSAARMVSVWSVELVVEALMELVDMRAF